MQQRDQKEILIEIAEQQSSLSRLEKESTTIRSRLATLKKELNSCDSGQHSLREDDPKASDTSSPRLTSIEKVALFRALFRGRDDLYPKLWTNSKTGRKGYAPACSNEWVRGC